MQILDASLPYLRELHLKNTDARFEEVLGFSPAEREKGIVEIQQVRDHLLANAPRLPTAKLIGYLEITGPKTGRDYSDWKLEEQLRGSLRYLRETFTVAEEVAGEPSAPPVTEVARRASSVPTSHVQIAASIMCCDLCHLEESVRRLEAGAVDCLHFDIMDGRFTPNMPLGLEMMRQLRPLTALPFDVHLMVQDNDFFVREMLDLGVEQISVHAESALHLHRTLGTIKAAGACPGVALNPGTSLSHLEYALDRLDFVLIMTVNPGFAGQEIVPSGIGKIARCRDFLERRGRKHIAIQVDGNVSFANIPHMIAAGADIMVAGSSSLFHEDGSLGENLRKIREAIAEGLKMRREGAGASDGVA